MSESSWSRLIEYRRNGISEVVIHGAVAWVSGKTVIHEIGGRDLIYGRSLTKPFQMKGLAEVLDRELTIEGKALSVASHGSEEKHLATLNEMLDADRLKLMLTPPSMPLGAGVVAKSPSPFYHPCSGKHAAILKACDLSGWPKENYTAPDHPYHQSYVAELKRALGPDWKPFAMAKDGCGLPTFSMTVSELAQLYANLVKTRAKDWIWQAMTEKPELVGGSGRLDTAIMQACGGRVLAKEGADGLLGLSIQHEDFPQGLGVAIKIAHGWDPKATWFIASAVLRTLGFEFGNPAPLDRQRAFVSRLIAPEKYRPKLAAIIAADTATNLDDHF